MFASYRWRAVPTRGFRGDRAEFDLVFSVPGSGDGEIEHKRQSGYLFDAALRHII
jgi:hypothetical protein